MDTAQQVLTPTDQELTAVIARRDESAQTWRAAQDACQELYQRHAPRLLTFLGARTRRSELEDVCQDVWERAWRLLPSRFRSGNFRAWLFEIGVNHLIDLNRKKAPAALTNEDALPDQRPGSPLDALVECDRQVALRRCLAKLDSVAANLVRARLEGETYEDVCPRLGLTAARAHKLFHQAKDDLQQCLERAAV